MTRRISARGLASPVELARGSGRARPDRCAGCVGSRRSGPDAAVRRAAPAPEEAASKKRISRSRSPAPISAPQKARRSSSPASAAPRNIVRNAPQVLSVLSTEDIAADRRGRHRRRAAARHRPQRGRQRLRLCPRPRRPLFAGAAQRLAAAQPRAAAPRRSARHLPDQHHRLARWCRRASRPTSRASSAAASSTSPPARRRARPSSRSAGRSAATRSPPATSATPIMAATATVLGYDDGTRDVPACVAAPRHSPAQPIGSRT